MLKKNYNKSGKSCRVTFKLPADVEAETVALLGEFNEWDADSHPLKRRKDGSYSTTVSLEAGQEYRFRYLLDNDRWINDEAIDGEAVNRFGTVDGVLELTQPAA